MQLSLSHDFPRVAAKLDQLRDDIANRAQASMLNKAGDQGKTASVREISQEYAVSAKYARDRITVSRATFKQGRYEMEVTIRAGNGRKRAANVIAFSARKTSRGLTVKIKRTEGRKVIKGAFIGNKGRTVFERVGAKRLPIKPVQTIDVPQMFNARRIKGRILQVIMDRLPGIADNEIAFYVKRFNGSK
jgi:hypothetical protein